MTRYEAPGHDGTGCCGREPISHTFPLLSEEVIIELGREMDTVLKSDLDLFELPALLYYPNSMLDELEKSQDDGLRPVIRPQAR